MMMSIATVSLSGALDEKLEAIAAAGFDGVEIFENDLLSFNGTPADVRRMVRGPRPRHRHASSRSATSRACRTAQRDARLRPRRAQVRPDGRSSAATS